MLHINENFDLIKYFYIIKWRFYNQWKNYLVIEINNCSLILCSNIMMDEIQYIPPIICHCYINETKNDKNKSYVISFQFKNIYKLCKCNYMYHT